MEHSHIHEHLPEVFSIIALLAGLAIAMMAAPLGCFVVWRRMAYFGDSLAHVALLGVALGLFGAMPIHIGILLVCAVFAVLLVWLQHKRILATDTLLGILAHAALSIGMIVATFVPGLDLDLHSYLFGDIHNITETNLWWILGSLGVVMLMIFWLWQPLLLLTLHEDLAHAEGISTLRTHILFMGLVTLVVAVSVQLVGLLLITSLLIIPAATARQVTRSPEHMAIMAAFLGMLSISAGLFISYQWHTPTGPAVVCMATLLFIAVLPFSGRYQRHYRG